MEMDALNQRWQIEASRKQMVVYEVSLQEMPQQMRRRWWRRRRGFRRREPGERRRFALIS